MAKTKKERMEEDPEDGETSEPKELPPIPEEPKELILKSDAIRINDPEAERYFNQIRNLENAKNVAKIALEALKNKYPEDWYLDISDNGRIKILISDLFILKWKKTFTKGNPKPKPIEEKEGIQFLVEPLKKSKETEVEDSVN